MRNENGQILNLKYYNNSYQIYYFVRLWFVICIRTERNKVSF